MDAKTLFFLDVSKDGYFNGKMFLEQIRVRLNNVLLPRYSTHHGHVDCFDNSSGHGFFADDALLVSKLNKLPGWCREEPALIRDGWFLQRLNGSQNDHIASQDEANTFRNRKGDLPPSGWKLQAQHMFFRVGDIVHVHIPANKNMQMIDEEEDNNNPNPQPSQEKGKAKKRRSNHDIDKIMGKFISSQAGEADIDASQPTPPPPPLSRKKATLKTTKAYSPGDILAVDDIAVIGALKGVEQILLERGVRFEQKACSSKKLIVQYKTRYKQAIEDFREDKYNVEKLENVINQKTPDEVEILANNLNCRCPHCVLRKQPDFAFKQNAMEELYSMFNNTHGTDFQCIFLPKFHPELNPIERVWSAMKSHVHKRLDFKGPSMRELENLMRQGLSSEYLPISRIRKYFGTSWNYMEEYRQGSTLLQADEHIKQRRSHRSYSAEMDSKIDRRPGSANSPSSRPTMDGQPTPTNCLPSLLQSLASATSSQGTSSSSGHHIARSSGTGGSGSTNDLSASIRKTLAGEEATIRSALTATAADKIEAIAGDDVELKSTQHDGDDDDVNDDADIDLMMQRWERGVAILDVDCEDD
jgi:transposase